MDKEILRAGIIAELDAINLYEQMAAMTENADIKRILLDIAKEEKTHFGEFQTLLLKEDLEQEKELEESARNPLKASVYTGSAYVLTVLFLIFPFLLLTNLYFCLGWTILNAIIVIFVFTFYISVAKDLPFKKRFAEMTLISLGVAGLTFAIGFLIRAFLNVEI